MENLHIFANCNNGGYAVIDYILRGCAAPYAVDESQGLRSRELAAGTKRPCGQKVAPLMRSRQFPQGTDKKYRNGMI